MSVEEFKGQHKTKLKVGAADSVTRLGQIPPLRKSLTVFGNLLRVYLVFGQIMNLLWPNLICHWANVHCFT